MSKHEVKIEKFLQEQKSKNTQYKTKSDLNVWKKFCESLKESRAIEDIPANELDLLLSKFFNSVRKHNGTEYEPGTLSGFQQSFQCHLHEKGSLINILKDNDFCKSREVLAAKWKNLVPQERGNCPNAKRELTEAKKRCTIWKWPVRCSGSKIITKGFVVVSFSLFWLEGSRWMLGRCRIGQWSWNWFRIPCVEVRERQQNTYRTRWWSSKSVWMESAHK